ncbi:MAG: winged helix-turn-helix domain-containing protein [Anaerobacillus sp.]
MLTKSVKFYETYKEVRETYQVEPLVRGELQSMQALRRKLEVVFGFPVEQMGKEDFLKKAFPGATDGYFCFFELNGKRRRNHFKDVTTIFDTVEELVEKTWGRNMYISYSTYFRKERYFKKEKLRTPSNIRKTHLLVQDLDFYQEGMTINEALGKVARLIHNGAIICPTFLLFSGNGLQLIYSVEPFKNIKGFTHDLEWKKVQQELYDVFAKENLIPDDVVKNPSAVTPFPGTKKKTTGKLNVVFHMNAAPLRLDDLVLHHGIVPYPDREVKPRSGQQLAQKLTKPRKVDKPRPLGKVYKHMKWNTFTYNRFREEDVFVFVREMTKREKSLIGYRSWLSLFLSFHALVSSNGDSDYALNRVKELWEVLPDKRETSLDDLISRGWEQAVKYYNQWVDDTWDRNEYVQGGLFYKTETVLKKLNILDDYEIQYKMNVLKIRNKDYEAWRWRYRTYGKSESEHTWEKEVKRRTASKDEKIEKLKDAIKKNPKAKQKELAKIVGITPSRVSQLMKTLKN